MTIPSGTQPSARRVEVVWPRAVSVAVVLTLLALFPVLALLPGRPASVRIAGVSLLWWYGGLLAPVAGWALAAGLQPRRTSLPPSWMLAVWLTPVVSLATTALIVSSGTHGLWLGLVVTLAPLVALQVRGRPAPDAATATKAPLHAAILILVVALVIVSNVALAADIATVFGVPRWHAVVIVAGAALVLASWRGAGRARSAVMIVALIAVTLPLLALAYTAQVGPVGAWDRLASRPAFQFTRDSPWVTEGRDLPSGPRQPAVLLAEAQRLTAPAGGVLRVLTRDGAQPAEREWKLGAGESVTLRPGDRVEADHETPVRFEVGRRVPGSPASGPAWAEGRPDGWGDRIGLGLTLIGGAIAFFGPASKGPATRSRVLCSGAGLVVALLVAQGWAVYGLLQAPELFLGGATAARLAELPALTMAAVPAGPKLQGLLLVGLLACFLGATMALRERAEAGGIIARGGRPGDAALLGLVALGAIVASVWPLDPWALTVWAVGVAASSLAPATLVVGARPAPAVAAAGVGFVIFTAVWVLGAVHDPVRGPLGVVVHYPALVAAPAALLLLWAAPRLSRQ